MANLVESSVAFKDRYKAKGNKFKKSGYKNIPKMTMGRIRKLR